VKRCSIIADGSVGKPTKKTKNYSIAIIVVLLTCITAAPLVPVAFVLLGLAIISGKRKRNFEKPVKQGTL
jgi:hypothetical protein